MHKHHLSDGPRSGRQVIPAQPLAKTAPLRTSAPFPVRNRPRLVRKCPGRTKPTRAGFVGPPATRSANEASISAAAAQPDQRIVTCIADFLRTHNPVVRLLLRPGIDFIQLPGAQTAVRYWPLGQLLYRQESERGFSPVYGEGCVCWAVDVRVWRFLRRDQLLVTSVVERKADQVIQ